MTADKFIPFASLEAPRHALNTYREATERFFDFIPTWEPLVLGDEAREVARLTHQSIRDHAGVIRELVISPLWMNGIASPSDLGGQFQKAIETDRQLAEAWVDLVQAQGQLQITSVEDVVDAASDAFDRTDELTVDTSDAIREIARTTVDASTEAVSAATDSAEHVVEMLRESTPLNEPGAETQAPEDKKSANVESGSVPPASKALPTNTHRADRPERRRMRVKGNTTRDGELIFHVEGQSSYDNLQTETLFASQSDAIVAGYRIARSAGGPSIKGNIGRDGARIYHLPGQVNYDRVEAEALFADEEEAQAEGFRAALR